jgi:hypothetical protein
MSEDAIRIIKTSGYLLFFGAVLIILTIIIEKLIGWPPEGGLAERISLISDKWLIIKWLWSGQMIGCLFFLLSSILLLSSNYLESFRSYLTLFFAVNGVGSMCAIIAFSLTLGSYPSALSVYSTEPEILNSIAGGIRTLYNFGMNLCGISLFAIFVREIFHRDGLIPRAFLYLFIASVALSLLLAYSALLPYRTAGGVVFLIPAMIGIGLVRHVKSGGPSLTLP